MPSHEHYMQHALALASKAIGCTSPNPLVGAVIVRNDTVVGQGWHHKAGENHAEVNAILDASGDTQGATIYVSLEPCSHHGRTPPCTQAIINAGITTVVYAANDNNPQAEGGASQLKAAGIEVIAGVCELQAKQLNRFFFHFQQLKQPYVIAKFASSLDGRIATRTGHSQWITGEPARQKAHALRQAVDAIVVGANTVITDNPELTVRLTNTEKVMHPLRLVLDSRGTAPLSSKIFQASLPGSTLVITTDAMSAEHKQLLERQGVEVVKLPSSTIDLPEAAPNARPDINALMALLTQRQIQSVMVEGGRTVLGEFFDHGFVNEVWAFVAPMIIGGENALPSIGGLGIDKLSEASQLENMQIETVGNDILLTGRVTNAQVIH